MDRPLPASIPKSVAPFLARAKELQARDPVVAYWCKYQAAELILKKLPSDAQGQQFIGALVDDLEDIKAKHSDNELIADNAAGSAHIYNFASRIFDNADKVDRDGRATRITAKEFLASSLFYELLAIFGPVETEVSEKIIYAKWKATSIARAFRDGVTPVPGPAGGLVKDDAEAEQLAHAVMHSVNVQDPPAHTDDFEMDSSSAADHASDADHAFLPSVPPTDYSANDFSLPDPPAAAYDLPSAPPDGDLAPASFTNGVHRSDSPPIGDSPIKYVPPPAVTAASGSTTRPVTRSTAAARVQIVQPQMDVDDDDDDDDDIGKPGMDPMVVANAQKHAKWAISALNYEDVETARKELKLALSLIGG